MATNEYSTKERAVERLLNRHFFFYYFFSRSVLQTDSKGDSSSHVTQTPPITLTPD